MFRNQSMFKKSIVLLAMMLAAGSATHLLSQCKNLVTMLPLSPMKAAVRSRDFVRYRYSLSSADSLLIRSHEDTETTIGPYDLGFVITHDGKTTRSVTLQNLQELRREDADFAGSFATLAVTRVCGNGGPMYFVTMKYMGDELSPALVFVIVPSGYGYEVSALPMFSGGTVDISTADPFHLRVWHNLNEGMCNACETAYRITEYEIRDGKPVQIRQYRTRLLYSTSHFGDSRIRFVP